MEPVTSPMRSTMPEARDSPASGSISWYLMEEEPELMTRTVRVVTGVPFWLFDGAR
jgi:hypothetical protein